jgi:glycolate oxidase iron-sulfur subunit
MPAFDAHRPPEQSVIDDCVHCGFCLDSCPTYTLWSDEADSPRGRIVLMAEGLADGSELSDEMVTHFDRCLGCMACVSSCPSGVAYDRLIERVRPQVERHYARPRAERLFRRLLFETLPHPGRMRALAPLLAATRRLPLERLDERLAMAAKVAPHTSTREVLNPRLPTRVAAVGERRGRVGLLLGCVQRVFFADVHRATIATLAAEGFEVYAPRLPNCCGALELHAGAEDGAIARARKTIAAFADVDYVVTSAAGCGSAMKDYGDLIEDAPARLFSDKVRDVCELLAASASPTTMPAISPTPRASARSRARSCARSPGSSSSKLPSSPRSAAARPGSTTWCSQRRRPSSAPARPPTSSRPGPKRSRPAIPAARPRSIFTSARPVKRFRSTTRSSSCGARSWPRGRRRRGAALRCPACGDGDRGWVYSPLSRLARPGAGARRRPRTRPRFLSWRRGRRRRR